MIEWFTITSCFSYNFKVTTPKKLWPLKGTYTKKALKFKIKGVITWSEHNSIGKVHNVSRGCISKYMILPNYYFVLLLQRFLFWFRLHKHSVRFWHLQDTDLFKSCQEPFSHGKVHKNLLLKAVSNRDHVYLRSAPFSDKALTSSAYEATPCISVDAYSQTKTSNRMINRRLDELEFT